jgi:hypothetical protein
MSIETYSAFIYGHTIDESNRYLDFSESAVIKQAELAVGAFSLTEFLSVLSNALNAAGSLDYTVNLDRTTRRITISATGDFDLLVDTGSNKEISVFTLAGFTGADRTGLSTYEGDSSSGSYYEPQNILQSYTDFEDNKKTNNASVNESASGKVEVVSYAVIGFMKCNIQPVSDVTPQLSIKDDANARLNLRNFLEYCITKAPIEFVYDVDSPGTFKKCLLEATQRSRTGVDFEIRRFKNLFHYYQSGNLTFRELE